MAGVDSRAWAGPLGAATLQIGMDTPQVSPTLLDLGFALLEAPGADAVLGLAGDGGWWAIGMRRADPQVFDGVPMSDPNTGTAQLAALTRRGHRVRLLPLLRDVDTAADLQSIARPALFLPESMTALDVIESMRESRSHMALIINEYGGLEGLVTINDIVEAILGTVEQLGPEDEAMLHAAFGEVYCAQYGGAPLDLPIELLTWRVSVSTASPPPEAMAAVPAGGVGSTRALRAGGDWWPAAGHGRSTGPGGLHAPSYGPVTPAAPRTMPRPELGPQTDIPRIDWLGFTGTGYAPRPYTRSPAFVRMLYLS